MIPFISVSKLTAIVAGEATHISPYHCPDDLVKVCREFYRLTVEHCRLKGFPEDWPIVACNRESLIAILDLTLFSQEEVWKWNQRKNGNKSEFQFISRYDGPIDPDDDFIDLDALKGNIIREALRFEREETKACDSMLRPTRRSLFQKIRRIIYTGKEDTSESSP